MSITVDVYDDNARLTKFEPATSGVTGRIGCYDSHGRMSLNGLICRAFLRLGSLRFAWVRGSSKPRLGHEWATHRVVE